MNSAIVTGANGFVGSAVTRLLCENGIKVYAIDRNSQGRIANFSYSNLEFIACDMKDIYTIKDILEDKSVDVFFHFAWNGTSGVFRASYEVQLSNVKECCMAVEIAKRMGCKRFVFANSIMEYEFKKNYDKGMPLSINSLYSVSKMHAEYMSRIIANDLGLEYISVIISNVYGEGEISERLLNSTIRKILNREKTEFTDGTQMYDFIHIEDAAKAFMLIGQKGVSGKKYYLGSLNPQPLKNYLLILKDKIAPSYELGLGLISNTNVSLDYYQEFNIFELKEDTGFEPTVSFEEGICRTIEWMENR